MVSLMEVCSSISHAPRAIIARHRFAAAIPALMIMPLVLSPQPSQAQGVCELLDQVVASATESTPFRSVRYLSAPQGKCQVAQDDEHEDMGAYIPAYSIIRKGEDIEYVDSWLCLWQDATLNQLWDEYERIDEYLDNLDRGYPGYRQTRKQARRQREEVENAIGRAADALHSQARELVSSIQQCIREGSIRGSWSDFWDDIDYDGPLAKLSVDSGRRKNTEVSILGGA